MPTKSVNLVNIDPGYSDIFWYNKQFLLCRHKVIILIAYTLGLLDQISPNLHNAEKFMLFNLLKLQL